MPLRTIALAMPTTWIVLLAVFPFTRLSADELLTGDAAADVPFMGDWEGRWSDGRPPELCAQVIARGRGSYEIHFLPALGHRCPPLGTVDATVEGDTLRFDHDGWTGAIRDGLFTGTGPLHGNSTEFALERSERSNLRLGASPPDNATVLFDGGSLDHWESDGRGGVTEIQWKQIDDFIRVWPPISEHGFRAAIRTRGAWSDFHLHLEFRLPLIAEATGQTRANSGVIIEEFEFYEVQVLDSYGLPGYWDETGAIYRKAAPKVNVCAPPGTWQSYDIIYHAPRLDENGDLVAKARITVDLNGHRVQNDVALPYSNAAMKNRREKPELKTPGRITLQHHGDPIDYRNIWIVDLAGDTRGQ